MFETTRKVNTDPETSRFEVEVLRQSVPPPDPDSRSNKKIVFGDSDNIADILVNLAMNCSLFWIDREGRACASFDVASHFDVAAHKEHAFVESTRFKMFLRRIYYEGYRGSVRAEAVSQACATLAALAASLAPTDFFIRVGEHEGSTYIDLCDDNWRAIRIDASGWTIDPQPGARFRRFNGARPLPLPSRDGSIEDLKKYLNLKDDADFLLILAWLTAALRPRGPYAILVVEGEQGSAKSTSARILRSLCDPYLPMLRSEPRDERDLAISANNSWTLAYDNISRLPNWLSDGLCRIATGGGFATRKLYTDNEESFFDFKRPILLNGIADIANRPDLLDRAIVLKLPIIPESSRRRESDFLSDFDRDRPAIFGALLDLIVDGTAKLGTFKLDRHSRMADFDEWGTAVALALGYDENEFLKVFGRNRDDSTMTALESSIAASCLIAFMADREQWSGTASQLFDELSALNGESPSRRNGFPKRPCDLSRELVRLSPPLRKIPIDLVFERGANARSIRITRPSK